MIQSKLPFAVMQSFVWTKGAPNEKMRVYETLSVKISEDGKNILDARGMTDIEISDFKVIKSSLKCEKCNFSLLNLNDIIPNSISKDPEELKEYIGSVCQSCNSGRLYLFI